MKHQSQIPLLILAVLLLVFPAWAQQPASEEERIKSLRVNIQRMVENGPPSTAPDETHQKTLLSLRGQLVRLLLKKSGALESRIGNLEAPGAMPEVLAYATQLRGDLKTVNDEISSLDRALGGALPPAPVPSPSVSPAQVSPTTSPVTINSVSADRSAFDKAVASFTRADLKAAALPEEVAKLPAPPCGIDGKPRRADPATGGPSTYDRAICRLAFQVVTDKADIDLENDQSDILTLLTAKLLKAKKGEGESYAAFVTQAQEQRIDQQMGASPTANSATSIVAKGGIPSLLGFAVENGAATQTEKDTSITFRVNPGGLINLFAKKGFITGFQASENDPLMKFLNKTSVGVTFDTSRGDNPGVFTGRGQQLSQLSARVEFFNDRDPRQSKYAVAWERFVATEGTRLANQVWKLTDLLVNRGGADEDITFKDEALEAWVKQMNQAVDDVDASLPAVERINAIARVIDEQAEKVPVGLVSDDAVETITDFAREIHTYEERKNELLDRIAKGRIFTIEYTNKREVNASDTSNFNFIYATGTRTRIDLTANGSFTFFHTRPPAISPASPRPGRIRDFQFAGQIDVPFKFGEGQFDLWFSGRYERLMEDATLPGGLVVPNTKGDVAIGQIGLNVPIRGLGVKFPISVTFSNRTELIKEKTVRGNFGFTFNWDTLLSKLKPF